MGAGIVPDRGYCIVVTLLNSTWVWSYELAFEGFRVLCVVTRSGFFWLNRGVI
jgi:hypothetical protein